MAMEFMLVAINGDSDRLIVMMVEVVGVIVTSTIVTVDNFVVGC